MESYDSFLLGLPTDLKSNDCEINKPPINLPIRSRPIANLPQNNAPAAKRKRTDDGIVNSNIMSTKAISLRSNRTSESTQLSKSVNKIGSEISIKKVVSKVIETSASRAIAKNDDDIIFCGVEQVSKDRKKSLDAARGRTDFYMYLAENRMSSPKNHERRMTIGGPLITTTTSNNRSAQPDTTMQALGKIRESTEEIIKTKAKTSEKRPKIIIEKVAPNIVRELSAASKPMANRNPLLSVTLPTTLEVGGIVTRSRGNNHKQSFKCNECNYVTEVRSNLDRHKLTHTGQKPFNCKVCDKKFTQKVNLFSHMRSNHQDLHGNPSFWEL